MNAMAYTRMDSPVGDLLLAGDTAGLRVISFLDGAQPTQPQPDWEANAAPFADALRQLQAYFAGDLTAFELVLAPRGTTFQQAVWAALRRIPYAATTSYGALARELGRPTASRAVGAANGRNPLPIVVPCHRVVGSDGSLTGFAGGLAVKEALLALERRHAGLTLV